jgi:hypothetical protein
MFVISLRAAPFHNGSLSLFDFLYDRNIAVLMASTSIATPKTISDDLLKYSIIFIEAENEIS